MDRVLGVRTIDYTHRKGRRRLTIQVRGWTNNTMTPEEIYDTEIAPGLRKISLRCQELGFPFVAQVEWKRGETGRTEFCPDKEHRPSAAQLLVHYAARSHGNFDALIMAVIKDSEKYGHSSMYLRLLNVPEKPISNSKPE